MNTSAILKLYFDFMRTLPPGTRQAIWAAVAAVGAAIITACIVLLCRILRECRQAYQETQERQRAWHPDPEAERREVAALRRSRARGDRARVEYSIMHGRRDALRAREARKDAARKATRAAGVH